jgi:hypothetical protein
LVGILAAGLLGFLLFPYDLILRSVVTVATAVAFVAWGIVHHWLHEDLHPKVVLEYIITSFLAALILLFMLWRS